MLLARGTRQILENMEFILLCSLMFGIDLFSFVLLLIDDWRCKSTFAKLFFAKLFFANPLQQPFHQNFLPPKLLTIWYAYVVHLGKTFAI